MPQHIVIVYHIALAGGVHVYVAAMHIKEVVGRYNTYAYEAIASQYPHTLACPSRVETHVALSGLERKSVAAGIIKENAEFHTSAEHAPERALTYRAVRAEDLAGSVKRVT